MKNAPENLPRASNPGLREIARAAGVSPMTVSRVLRNEVYVRAEVKTRVLEWVRELGYRPDPLLARMMGHLRRKKRVTYQATLAALTDIPAEAEPHTMSRVKTGAQRRAEELGYRLDLVRLGAVDRRNPGLERSLVNKGVEGVLLLQFARPSSLDNLLGWDRFSVVAATSSVLSPSFPVVGVDYYGNARLLCANLRDRGLRKVGFVGSATFGVRTNEAFISAICREAEDARELPVRPLITLGSELGGPGFEQWFRREKPGAIVAHSEELVLRLRERLGVAREKFPIFCTSLREKKPVCPGIDERLETMGRKAVDELVGMLHRHEKNVRAAHARLVIEGRWVEPL